MMRLFLRNVLPGVLFLQSALAQEPVQSNILGGASHHEVTWTTSPGYNYQVLASDDLESWFDLGIVEPGTGDPVAYGFPNDVEKLFYRIRETPDPHQGHFLVLPSQAQEVGSKEGVRFAFDLEIFPTLPSKLRIYQRDYGVDERWEQIGTITDFMERKGVRCVRGSVVWLPDGDGEYEVLAAAIDDEGQVMASAKRLVIVGGDPLTIEITSGPPATSAEPVDGLFTTSFSGGGEVRRVEFYDNGMLIGTDFEAPFGDDLVDPFTGLLDLLRGSHEITAKAFDSLGNVAVTAEPYTVTVTGGNARPEIEIVSPVQPSVIEKGDPLVIEVSASDPDGDGTLAWVEAAQVGGGAYQSALSAPFTLTMDTSDWQPGKHVIRLAAIDNEFDSSYFRYLDVIVTDGGGPGFADTLAANLVDFSTISVSEASFVGVEPSSAVFEDGLASGLQMDEGIVLTSGSAALWNWGNRRFDTDERQDGNFGPNKRVEPGDPELEALVVAAKTTDAAVLELGAMPMHGQLEVEYQFGSEEYLDYVGAFNDGCLISVDGVPVNLVPDASDIVAANTVHRAIGEGDFNTEEFDAINGQLYLDNDQDIRPTVAPGDIGRLVEYDGMTVRLKAHVLLGVGAERYIRFAIADADGFNSNDDLFDSAIFLEKGTFRSVEVSP